MRLIVLGAAAGGGFPQWNCNCPNCRRARAGDPKALPRTQSSLALSADGERWVLLNASPDLRQQIASTAALHPRRPGRHSPIAAVVLTSADIDHVAGLLNLRESQKFALYATDRVQAVLRESAVFRVLAPAAVARHDIVPDRPLELSDGEGAPLGLAITPFAVPGKIALYLEDAAAEGWGTQSGDTIGIECSAAGRRGYYIPACAEWTPALAARLAGADLVLFDGTLWRDDELPAAGVGQKSGRRMGHMSMAGEGGTIAAFSPLKVGRKIFVHINNTNPVLLADTAERAAAERAGWEIAYDGMEIEL
jgi:pyrroloquinoline quinone biosynthesis protein B